MRRANGQDMILLLEPHPRARVLLQRELRREAHVYAPDLAAVTPGQAIAGALESGTCELVVLAGDLPGTTPASMVQVLRAYAPDLPAVVMTRQATSFPPLDGVVTVSYPELGTLLLPTVAGLLADESGELPALVRTAPVGRSA
jgi:hypothetical protein